MYLLTCVLFAENRHGIKLPTPLASGRTAFCRQCSTQRMKACRCRLRPTSAYMPRSVTVSDVDASVQGDDGVLMSTTLRRNVSGEGMRRVAWSMSTMGKRTTLHVPPAGTVAHANIKLATPPASACTASSQRRAVAVHRVVPERPVPPPICRSPCSCMRQTAGDHSMNAHLHSKS